jgi:hypothetical protein
MIHMAAPPITTPPCSEGGPGIAAAPNRTEAGPSASRIARMDEVDSIAIALLPESTDSEAPATPAGRRWSRAPTAPCLATTRGLPASLPPNTAFVASPLAVTLVRV